MAEQYELKNKFELNQAVVVPGGIGNIVSITLNRYQSQLSYGVLMGTPQGLKEMSFFEDMLTEAKAPDKAKTN